MIDLVRFDDERVRSFCARFSIEPVVFTGDGLLRAGELTLLDASSATNKTLPGLIAKHPPSLVFGCEWTAKKDHMDYPGAALRIQSARALRDASAIYVITPAALRDPRVFAVARFNAKVLRQAKVPVVFCSLATRASQLATPTDLSAIGHVLGFSDEELARSRALLEKLPDTRFEKAFAVELAR